MSDNTALNGYFKSRKCLNQLVNYRRALVSFTMFLLRFNPLVELCGFLEGVKGAGEGAAEEAGVPC